MIGFFVEQRTSQGIVENNRKISWKLVELNSWVWSGKERMRNLPKPLASQGDLSIQKLCLPEEKKKTEPEHCGMERIPPKLSSCHETNKKITITNPRVGKPIPTVATIYYPKCMCTYIFEIHIFEIYELYIYQNKGKQNKEAYTGKKSGYINCL